MRKAPTPAVVRSKLLTESDNWLAACVTRVMSSLSAFWLMRTDWAAMALAWETRPKASYFQNPAIMKVRPSRKSERAKTDRKCSGDTGMAHAP